MDNTTGQKTWRHRLSAIDRVMKTAVCAMCGPVKIRVRGNGNCECMVARNQWKETLEEQRARGARYRRSAEGKNARSVYRNSETYMRLAFRGRQQRYGWDPLFQWDQYQEVLLKQRGACAICKRAPDQIRRLAVDHDHSTGRVRGLLCSACNLFIGKYNDDPAPFAAAAIYLQ